MKFSIVYCNYKLYGQIIRCVILRKFSKVLKGNSERGRSEAAGLAETRVMHTKYQGVNPLKCI